MLCYFVNDVDGCLVFFCVAYGLSGCENGGKGDEVVGFIPFFHVG